MRKKFKEILGFVFFVVVFSSFGQQNEIKTNFNTKIHKAVELYNSRLYASAQKLFIEVSKNTPKESNLKAKADYYDVLCAIKLQQTQPEKKVLAFVENYPNNSLQQKAFYNIGNYYYSNQKAAHALEWYSKVDPKYLTEDQLHEMNFKMGYMFLITDYYADAKEKFRTLLGSPEYGNDSRYYYGYISHRQENFEEANENFAQLANNASYQEEANYYLLDMAFKNGEFEKAIKIGEKVLSKAKGETRTRVKSKKGKTEEDRELVGNKSDIIKIIGESYFNLGEYQKCIPYLMQYKDERGKWNNTNLYYIGYAYYKQNDYEKAAEYFTKIISGTNTISQNAYYHLGICYMKLDKKAEALNAFKNAYEMPFVNEVQEDAALNYTKLSYEEGNPYNSISNTIKEYMSKYPTSKENPKLEELLITSYLHEHDFVSALKYLNSNKEKNHELTEEVSLYRAIQLFQEKEYRRAMPYFLVASNSKDPKIKNKALYWMAESQYLLGKYKEALYHFLKVDKTANLEKFKNIDYNIAYSCFKQNNYKNAGKYFKKFINSGDDVDVDMKDDAINRLGDSYYAIRDYATAIKNYNIIIESQGAGADYALYQRAMSKGLINKKNAKIKDLKKLVKDYPQSVYIDDALYQTAVTYNSLKKDKKAIPYFDEIIANHSSSSYLPSVLLRKGLYHYSQKDYANALTRFKEVVAKFPSSEEAKQAITNVRNVSIDQGDIQPYVTWVKTLPNVNISHREIDDSSFIAAQNLYFNEDFATAILSLKSYLQKFPEGAHLLNVNYYLGESFYNLGQKKRTIPYYRYVMEQEKNEFTEDVTSKLGQIYIDLNKWDEAIPVLEKLEREANLEHNVLFAKNNLMKSYFEKKEYKKAKDFANEVLMNSKLDQAIEEDAKLIIARIAILEKDYPTAREYYEVLDETAKKEVKAETLYYKALFLHEDEDYKNSNIEIQNLIAGYASYKYWGVKSYIVMAKNYFALGDSYQATYILENVIKNFGQYKDLVEDAQNELNKVKHQESKQNESINSNMGQ